MRIGILGATGYIGRSLLAEATTRGIDVVPFSRDAARAQDTLATFGIEAKTVLRNDVLAVESFDILINATGIGSSAVLAKDPAAVFAVTEAADAMLAAYHTVHPDARIFNMSSGAVYGRTAGKPVDDATPTHFTPNALDASAYYGLAKLASEAKHRALSPAPIIDLRVFTFFSAYASLEDSFFLSELARAIVTKTEFRTKPASMVRDCFTPSDLLDAILALTLKEPMNESFDLVSREPFEKFALLDACAEQFGLSWRTDDGSSGSPTGEKSEYRSVSTALVELGFTPTFTSQEGVLKEMEKLCVRTRS